MEGQPMLNSTVSAANDTIEEISGGCVMHRYKGHKAKRRWGQLRVEVKNKTSRCIILLYKHDLLNAHQEVNRSKEPKLKYELEFTKDDFCGLEKGEHLDRHGQRRYLCIITKQKHLIIEDAVVTAAGINHNVLGTWYQLISQAMHFVNRWKLIENNPKLAFKICYLHVTSENLSECHSLEDKTRENRYCLVLRTWKLNELTDVKEQINTTGEELSTDISFSVMNPSGGASTVCMTVEGTTNLQQTINQVKRTKDGNKRMTTVCPGFDDLNYHPNLIPKQKPTKGLKKYLPKSVAGTKGTDSLDLQRPRSSKQHGYGNLYVKLDTEEEKKPLPYYNVNATPDAPANSPTPGPSSSDPDAPSTSRKGAPGFHDASNRIQVPPSLLDHSAARTSQSNFMQSLPRAMPPSNGWHHHASPPQLPSPGFDDNDLKKAPGLATQTSFDSDYHTDEGLLTESSVSQSRYVNIQQNSPESPEPLVNGTQTRNHLASSSVYQNLTPDQPPAVPARDDEQPPQQPYVNIANSSSTQPPDRVPNPPPIPPKYSGNERPPAPPGRLILKEASENQAPPVPVRPSVADESPRPSGQTIDLLASSIQQGTLPPLRFMEEHNRAYENGMEFEMSINDVLQGTHLTSTGGRWLDLPHSVFVRIALGLEKEGITVGDWKALAERLGLTFYNVQQLSGLMHMHSMLRPLEVLLLHWSRTQSPLPFTRENFRLLLTDIGRDDLAQIIPS